ncbi:MAG TPA: hypothetical protein PLE64_14445, partial [Spirochaetota bacterium]|nr:hypothetical protein [Spirochaetota bacterium]
TVQRPIAGHPDIQLCMIHNFVIYNPAIEQFISKLLHQSQYIPIRGQSIVQPPYPYDCAYNCVCTGIVAFHNTKATDTAIQEILHRCSVPLIHVKQGYSKCSTCIVNTHAIITPDKTIHRAAPKNNITSLLIQPGTIILPGYPYGFFGGASGLCHDTVYVTGTLSKHPDTAKIEDFIRNHGKNIIYLSNLPAIDIGSIFFLDL